LGNNPNKDNYRPFSYMNSLEIRMSAGASKLIISRAGSTIFEIAAWSVPSIIIPLSETVSHDQLSNAFAYARSGAAEVIEENNLSAHVLLAEIERIVGSSELSTTMSTKAKAFAHPDAAEKIAQVILDIALEHED
jgi:UDP-N-acetylglucosamine--N-acetylmuramyl-(pentapeptide) pyrophosphoryl-undecaprenol N-acetylglucosamine transferase